MAPGHERSRSRCGARAAGGSRLELKLFHRLTGQAVVVHGAHGHAEARPTALLHVPMPAEADAVQAGGRPYAARTFAERGWAGEPLRVTVLVPTQRP